MIQKEIVRYGITDGMVRIKKDFLRRNPKAVFTNEVDFVRYSVESEDDFKELIQNEEARLTIIQMDLSYKQNAFCNFLRNENTENQLTEIDLLAPLNALKFPWGPIRKEQGKP